MSVERQVNKAIEIAKSKRGTILAEAISEQCKEKANFFSAHKKFTSDINIVFFHINIPAKDSVVETIDIKSIDHHAFEYEAMIALNIKVALWSNPRARVFLITDKQFMENFEHERVTVIRSHVVPSEPMYERVMAYNAYVQSTLFDAPTVFLDSDAFLINSPDSLFMLDFDVGVTHRDVIGQMPINEGVIFANNYRKDCVINFFNAYLSIYSALEDDRELGTIYQRIRRWRGGQLSINGASGGFTKYATGIQSDELGFQKALLPCSMFNLSLESFGPGRVDMFNRSMVLHFKGPRKTWISAFEESLYVQGFN